MTIRPGFFWPALLYIIWGQNGGQIWSQNGGQNGGQNFSVNFTSEKVKMALWLKSESTRIEFIDVWV